MKKFVVFVSAIFILLLATPVMAQEGGGSARPAGFGIGLGQGTLVSGLSLKKHTGGTALQGVVGCTRGGWGGRCYGFGLSGDFLVNMPTFFEADPVALAWNIGGGGSFGVGYGDRYRYNRWDRTYESGTVHIAAQFVAGLEIIFPDIPIDIVLEWRPHLRVAPFFDLWFGGAGAHIRFYLG